MRSREVVLLLWPEGSSGLLIQLTASLEVLFICPLVRVSGLPMIRTEIQAVPATMNTQPVDLSREVYCVLGIPIDAICMTDALRRIASAAAGRAPFLISTPNLNFLVNSHSDPNFRESLISSDLCTADGIPILWIAWLLRIPIKYRIAGSDIFDALKSEQSSEYPLKIFFFGGAEGVAAAASRVVNGQPRGICCVGSLYPGFCSVDEMSRDEIIDSINSSGADFLVASLGAQRGQMWLQRNYHRLSIPIRAHLGAALNFQAGTIRRAPPLVGRLGLEWLWRIKEEPYLWRRYWNDGRVFLWLLFCRVLPLAFWMWWLRVQYDREKEDLIISQSDNPESVTLSLSGPASARNVNKAINAFRSAILKKKCVMLDFSNTRTIDARFLGLLLMLEKNLKSTDVTIAFMGLSPGLQKIFRLNGMEFIHGVNSNLSKKGLLEAKAA
jgi:N-acetylglucosaminyldiphosphoundecaprenol N-acetyl-beta-D-mannosaminyltransferase